MKSIIKISIISCVVLAILFACDSNVDFGEQYKKVIYIVNSNDILYEKEYNFGVEDNSINISVYCAGTLPTDKDVKIEFELDPVLLDSINKIYAVADPFYINKILIPKSNYTVSNLNATIKSGSEYGVLKIPFSYDGLSPDSNYVLPLSIASSSNDYEINPKLSSIIYQVKMVNEYSGLYTGSSKELPSTNRAVQPYLKAISANQVRLPIHNLTDKIELTKTNFMLLTITQDIVAKDSVSVSIKPWNDALINDLGGSTLNTKTMSFDLYYSFINNLGKEILINEKISSMDHEIK